MGVPKFFRWISERYPKINCPLHCPPVPETRAEYFPDRQEEKPRQSNPNDLDPKELAVKSCFPPEFDRLYLDMNGIIHCASHNNASELNTAVDPDVHIDAISNANPEDIVKGCVTISEDEIFKNVAYYLDRIVCDIVQPKELVFLSIDGVAPRAKMNQQRGRRYRSGQEKEIEDVFYGAMQQQRPIKNSDNPDEGSDDFLTHTLTDSSVESRSALTPNDMIQEVEPGRFAGTFQTSSTTNSEVNNLESSPYDLDYHEFMQSSDSEKTSTMSFHSNAITPGTEFFENFTARLEGHLRKKLECDSRWSHLTVILSGPGVPGEGEHKIMDFIRREKLRKDYNKNTRHCLYGQDGDLIMLGLTTHEPNFCLLREEVIFDQARKRRMQLASTNTSNVNQETHKGVDKGSTPSSILMNSIDSYVNNASFELLHMSILRDYIAFEFETKEVLPENSSFELEPTIDDFVFMTFFVGNDFLPHMPALDIQDEAFELLFYAYKRNRCKWVLNEEMKGKDSKDNNLRSDYPYLTRAGEIVSGKRLESFLRTIGSYEDPYYDNKKRQETFLNERIRKADEKAGRDLSIPSAETLAAKEEFRRTKYMTMLESIVDHGGKKVSPGSIDSKSTVFTPVTSNSYLLTKVGLHSARGTKKLEFKPEIDLDVDEGLISKMGTLIKNSLAPNSDSSSSTNLTKNDRKSLGDLIDRDIKGRYYYEKFNFSPVDQEKHLKLRQKYIEGLVWTLAYYYKGCKDWGWFYPYHYGPMLSDLVNIETLLETCAFSRSNTEPLKPFEQLMACLPPSSSYLLPKPFQWLMRSSKSPIKEFYPDTFIVDMNGKRWPWEAVILLPFIDSKRLVQAVQDYVSVNHLTPHESKRNLFRNNLVFVRSMHNVTTLKMDDTEWGNNCNEVTDNTCNWPEPTILPGFPTLREVPVQSLIRRKVGINVFGMKSRYKSAILQLDSVVPQIPGVEILASRFIGTTVFFRYPFFQEGYVTAVSDPDGIVRGKDGYRIWSSHEKELWLQRNNTLVEQCETGEGITGSGGCNLFNGNCIFYIRPLKGIRTLANGSKVKVYARVEVDVPIVACLWSPTVLDPRLVGLPALLERNPFQFVPKVVKDRLPFNIQRNKPEKFRLASRAQFTSMTGMPHYDICTKVGIGSHLSSMSPLLYIHSRRQNQIIERKGHQSLLSTHPLIKRTYKTKSVIAACAVLAYTCFFQAGTQQQHVVNGEIPSLQKIKSQVIPHWTFHQGDHLVRPFNDEFQYIYSGKRLTPPLEFAHGTTTISFTFKDGIIAAVDSRASIGNFVGSKTTKKILEVNTNILGTMAGGAADCSFWIRKLQSEAKYHQLTEGKSMTIARASRTLANALYRNRGAELSVGTMIMGFDDQSGPGIYYVDSRGVRTFGVMFAVGSGSTFAIAVLDTERRTDMSEDEAIALGIKAIRHATFRDAYSGGYIGVYVINKHGWRKVFSEDIAASTSLIQGQ